MEVKKWRWRTIVALWLATPVAMGLIFLLGLRAGTIRIAIVASLVVPTAVAVIIKSWLDAHY